MRQYDKPIRKAEPPKDEHIVFSFERLQFNDYFNIDCTCSNWILDLMNILRSISTVSRKKFKTDSDFRSGTYRIHNLENATPPIPFPENMRDSEQIRISRSKGGIHGTLIGNVFYVIWLDPLHNMYPDDRYGGLKKIKPAITCCGWNDEELIRLSEENKLLNELLEEHS